MDEIEKHFNIDIVEATIRQVRSEISTKIIESKNKDRIKALKESERLVRNLFSSILAKHLNLK